MFSWFFKRDKLAELEKKQLALLAEARDVQRSGDLRKYAQKMEEIEALNEEITAERSRREQEKKGYGFIFIYLGVPPQAHHGAPAPPAHAFGVRGLPTPCASRPARGRGRVLRGSASPHRGRKSHHGATYSAPTLHAFGVCAPTPAHACGSTIK